MVTRKHIGGIWLDIRNQDSWLGEDPAWGTGEEGDKMADSYRELLEEDKAVYEVISITFPPPRKSSIISI